MPRHHIIGDRDVSRIAAMRPALRPLALASAVGRVRLALVPVDALIALALSDLRHDDHGDPR